MTLLSMSLSPHVLITGATGTGKTYAEKLLLARVALHLPESSILVCDFKAQDFQFLDGCARYYAYKDCVRGLEAFYTAFEARQRGDDQSRSFLLLVFDEWAAFLNTLDKQTAEDAKNKMATMLMLGRAFNTHILVSQQRADAHYFSNARDNFNLILALGNISREAAQMYGFDRKELLPVTTCDGGHMLINGTDLRAIQVPAITKLNKLHSAIRRIV